MNKSVIPLGAKLIAASLAGLTVFLLVISVLRSGPGPDPRFLMLLCVLFVLSGYALLVGYVYGDARRRGMPYVMWTWLAMLVPNAIGIILYFILRDPIPNYCTRCGAAAKQGYSFCPHCGKAMAPACTQCHRLMQEGWTHCAYCGAPL